MNIMRALPPNFAEIAEAFPEAKTIVASGQGIFFCYGDTIFNPNGESIAPQIMAHEKVHSARQNGNPAEWWVRYLTDKQFRLDEEIPAHRAEYAFLRDKLQMGRLQMKGFRSGLDFHLMMIAKRLSGPLYNNMLSLGAARNLITQP